MRKASNARSPLPASPPLATLIPSLPTSAAPTPICPAPNPALSATLSTKKPKPPAAASSSTFPWLSALPMTTPGHPERPFGRRESGVTAAAGRRDRGEHFAGLWIDLLDAILGDLKQVPAVEGRSRMRGDIDRAQRLPTRGIEGVQLVSRSK